MYRYWFNLPDRIQSDCPFRTLPMLDFSGILLFFTPGYLVSLMIFTATFALFSLGLNLQWGFTGTD